MYLKGNALSKTCVLKSPFCIPSVDLHEFFYVTCTNIKQDISSLRTEFLNSFLSTKLKNKLKHNYETHKSRIYNILKLFFWLLTKCILGQTPGLWGSCHALIQLFQYFTVLNHRKIFVFMVCCELYGLQLVRTLHYVFFVAVLISLIFHN